MHNGAKSTDQIKNDKFVHIFFNKLIAQQTEQEVKNLSKGERREYSNYKHQIQMASYNVDGDQYSNRFMNKMEDSDTALAKLDETIIKRMQARI